MYDVNTLNELKRLKFEDFIWVMFIFIALLNIYGDYDEQKYLKTNNKSYDTEANKVFEITIVASFLAYIYFFIRNYNAYKKASSSEKKILEIKLIGSALFLAGSLCLLYSQASKNNFIGTPA